MSSPFVKRATGRGGLVFDRAEARRALAALADPEHGVQIHALPSGRHVIRPSIESDALLDDVSAMADDGQQIYLILNPVPVGLGEAAKGNHVVSRRWLYIDIDPVKPEEHKNDPASETEHENAHLLASDIWNWLYQQQWPLPVRIDSGNGATLLYRIDLPNDEHARALIRAFLIALHEKYDGRGGKVDKAVHNANRLSRLPGTLNAKGQSSQERPYRKCKFNLLPAENPVVTADMIRTATARLTPVKEEVKTEPKPPQAEAFKKKVTGGPLKGAEQYAAKALQNELAIMRMTRAGELNTQLNKSAFALGQLVGAGLLNQQEVEERLYAAAQDAGADNPEKDQDTLRRGLEAGKAEPRKVEGANPGNAPSAAPADPEKPVVVKASSITPRKIEWLWPGRIPLGKLTTFAGIGGLGKTFVLCDITARVTTGTGWPDGPDIKQEPGKVLFVSGEDDADDTLIPRLIELKADLDRVFFLTTEVQDRFTLADLKTLDRAIEQAGEGVRFVAIDPPTAYLGGVDDHKNAELRGLLSPLKNWAGRNRVALIFNTHVNKPQGKVEAMMRVMGSVAWVNAVRAAHLFARDPDEPERRLFVGMKMNIGKERKGLAYRIIGTHDDLATVEWLGEVDTSADEAMNNQQARTRKVVASEWLIERFMEKLEWPSDELFRSAKEAGVSRDAIFEAKARLDLPRAKKRIAENGDTAWIWWVPENWDRFPTGAVYPTVAPVAPVDPEKDEESY